MLYKPTVKQFQSLQIIASVLYVYFFIKHMLWVPIWIASQFVDAIQMSTHNIIMLV